MNVRENAFYIGRKWLHFRITAENVADITRKPCHRFARQHRRKLTNVLRKTEFIFAVLTAPRAYRRAQCVRCAVGQKRNVFILGFIQIEFFILRGYPIRFLMNWCVAFTVFFFSGERGIYKDIIFNRHTMWINLAHACGLSSRFRVKSHVSPANWWIIKRENRPIRYSANINIIIVGQLHVVVFTNVYHSD